MAETADVTVSDSQPYSVSVSDSAAPATVVVSDQVVTELQAEDD